MQVMITGADGLIGSYLSRILDNKKNVNIIKFQGDITDQNNVESNFENLNDLDLVIHLAAIVPVGFVDKNPAYAYNVNVCGTINLFSAIKKLNLNPHFFYASTSHVYPFNDLPIKESSSLKPISIYGHTKMTAEFITSKLCESYNLSLCIGRIFSIYDNKQSDKTLFGNLKKRLLSEDLDDPFLLNGANSYRDFLPVERVAEIIAALSLKEISGTINIGSGKGMKIKDFAQSLTSKKLNVIDQDDTPSNSLVANITKLKESLDYQ